MHLYFEMKTGLLPEGGGRVGTWPPLSEAYSHTLPPSPPHPQHKITKNGEKAQSNLPFLQITLAVLLNEIQRLLLA